MMPYIADLTAHILFFKDHMATVHAHNGKYHVHFEVELAAKKDNSEKNPASVLKKETTGNEYTFAEKSAILPFKSKPAYSPDIAKNIPNMYLSSDFPPPKKKVSLLS